MQPLNVTLYFPLSFREPVEGGVGGSYPVKMCIKAAPFLHQKSGNWELNMIPFLCFMLMLLNIIDSSQITPLKGAVPVSIVNIMMPN